MPTLKRGDICKVITQDRRLARDKYGELVVPNTAIIMLNNYIVEIIRPASDAFCWCTTLNLYICMTEWHLKKISP